MGAFFTNYQVLSTDPAAVRGALEPLVSARAYVSDAKNGWVTVYDEDSDSQDDAILRKVAMGLSRKLGTIVFAFLVHDSDVLLYLLFRNGQLEDEFNSVPDYFGKGVDDDTRARMRGDADKLLPYCVGGTTRDDVEAVLHSGDGPAFAEQTLSELAKLLGIDEGRISAGFRYFEEEGDDLFDDIEAFTPVGKTAAKKEQRKRASPAPFASKAGDAGAHVFGPAVGMLYMTEQMMNSAASAPAVASFLTPDVVKTYQKQFDKQAGAILRASGLGDRISIEELIAARDRGPAALAELVATRVPEQLQSLGTSIAAAGYEPLLSALLAHGLSPTAPDANGLTPLSVAERHGKDSPAYRALDGAAAKRPAE